MLYNIDIKNMKIVNVFIILASLLLASCATDPKSKGVIVGMTQEQVLSIMGEPTKKRKDKYCVEGKVCNETWSYYGRQIDFTNGLVNGF